MHALCPESPPCLLSFPPLGFLIVIKLIELFTSYVDSVAGPFNRSASGATEKQQKSKTTNADSFPAFKYDQ